VHEFIALSGIFKVAYVRNKANFRPFHSCDYRSQYFCNATENILKSLSAGYLSKKIKFMTDIISEYSQKYCIKEGTNPSTSALQASASATPLP
jgi:hypothetical protein